MEEYESAVGGLVLSISPLLTGSLVLRQRFKTSLVIHLGRCLPERIAYQHECLQILLLTDSHK